LFRAVTSNSVGKAALGGWEVTGITRAQTGAPLNITAGTELTGTRRADYLGGDPYNDTRNPNTYFNRAVFTPASEITQGTSGPGNVRGPGLYLWHFSLRKELIVNAERGWRFRIQADFFNAFNRVNYRNRLPGGDRWSSRTTTSAPSRLPVRGVIFSSARSSTSSAWTIQPATLS
jgi:hypothetical protein